MKKSLIFVICWLAMVILVSSAQAVDRSPKTSDSEQKKEPTEIKEGKMKRNLEVTRKTNLPSEKTTVKDNSHKNAETKTVEGKEKYDYFLDRNNNGIDDRLEGNLKAKETKKPEIIKRKISTTPEKTTPKATPVVKPKEKVEERKSNEPRKEEIPAKIEKKRGSEKK
jgi:hypothetical protein